MAQTSGTPDYLSSVLFIDANIGWAVGGDYQKGERIILKTTDGGNSETMIEFQLPLASDVEMNIFNLQGQTVATLVKDHRSAGSHKIVWNGTDHAGQLVASGVYLYQLKTGENKTMKKMLLLR